MSNQSGNATTTAGSASFRITPPPTLDEAHAMIHAPVDKTPALFHSAKSVEPIEEVIVALGEELIRRGELLESRDRWARDLEEGQYALRQRLERAWAIIEGLYAGRGDSDGDA